MTAHQATTHRATAVRPAPASPLTLKVGDKAVHPAHGVGEVVAVEHRDIAAQFDKDLSFGERRLLDQAKSLLVKELALAKRVTEADLLAHVGVNFQRLSCTTSGAVQRRTICAAPRRAEFTVEVDGGLNHLVRVVDLLLRVRTGARRVTRGLLVLLRADVVLNLRRLVRLPDETRVGIGHLRA